MTTPNDRHEHGEGTEPVMLLFRRFGLWRYSILGASSGVEVAMK
jgi:hypothetical protein